MKPLNYTISPSTSVMIGNYEGQKYIRRMGVDVVQGYLMSKPVPKAELEKLIQHEESYL